MSLSKIWIVGAMLFGMLISTPLYAETSNVSPTTSITPAEIGTLATIATIDKNEILVSIIASHKKVDPQVAAFAKFMIKQHGSNLTQVLEIANQLHALPLTGGESAQLAAQGKKGRAQLSALYGTQFSKAYIDAMVKGHQAALDLIDQHLMKTAQSTEVKQFLMNTRAAVVQHLMRAKQLQEMMKA